MKEIAIIAQLKNELHHSDVNGRIFVYKKIKKLEQLYRTIETQLKLQKKNIQIN